MSRYAQLFDGVNLAIGLVALAVASVTAYWQFGSRDELSGSILAFEIIYPDAPDGSENEWEVIALTLALANTGNRPVFLRERSWGGAWLAVSTAWSTQLIYRRTWIARSTDRKTVSE